MLNYKQSDNFLDLAPRTKLDYEKVFTFLKPLWNASLSKFTTPEFVKLRRKWAKIRGRAFIDKTRAVMSILFAFAVEEGAMSNNPIAPTKRLKRPKDAKVYNRAWTIDERRAVIDHLSPHLKLPMLIGLYTGMREGDIIRMPPTIVQGAKIQVKTAKRNVWVYIPIPTELRVALHTAPKPKDEDTSSIRLCLNSRGQPWTLSGFSCSFRKALASLRAKDLIGDGLTFHGLRHTVASELAEVPDVTAEDIAAVLGQKSSQMAAHYSREADRSRRTAATMAKYQPLKNS
jgi:integrase